MKVTILGKNGPKMADLNRRKAIRERCLNCSGWIHKEVSNCEFSDCPLYPFRSGQGRQNPKARAKAIRKYCLGCMNDQAGEITKCPSIDCPLFPYRKTTVDRSVEIKSMPENEYIEPVFRDKFEIEYLNTGGNGKV